MIARVQDTTAGFILIIPPEYAEAWNVRQDMALEVHRVGSNHERDEPAAIRELHDRVLATHQETLSERAAAYQELARGPGGRGPHDDDLRI